MNAWRYCLQTYRSGDQSCRNKFIKVTCTWTYENLFLQYDIIKTQLYLDQKMAPYRRIWWFGTTAYGKNLFKTDSRPLWHAWRNCCWPCELKNTEVRTMARKDWTNIRCFTCLHRSQSTLLISNSRWWTKVLVGKTKTRLLKNWTAKVILNIQHVWLNFPPKVRISLWSWRRNGVLLDATQLGEQHQVESKKGQNNSDYSFFPDSEHLKVSEVKGAKGGILITIWFHKMFV